MTFAVGAIVVGATGLLYGATAARDIVLGDTPELITAAITFGVRMLLVILCSRCLVICSVCYP